MRLLKHDLKLRPIRRGFTLVELLVVLLVISALAGVIVPMIPSVVGQAHSASSAGNMAEIAQNVQMYQSRYGKYPDRLDSLIDSTGAAVISYLGGTVETALTVTDLGSDANGAAIAEAFRDVGVTTTRLHVTTNPSNPTFNHYAATSNSITASPAGGSIVEIPAANLAATVADLNLTGAEWTGFRFFLFGLGQSNTAIGKTMAEAPVHLPHEGSVNTEYQRFMLLFAVNATADEPQAQLISVVSADGSQLAGIGSHLSEYHQSRQ